MFARSQVLTAGDVRFPTPLFVPAFSSKGFELIEEDDGPVISTTSEALEYAAPSITDAFLVSAYDIYYERLKNVGDYLGNPSVVFVDSGGYEKDPEFDHPVEYRHPYEPDPWDIGKLQAVVDELPVHLPIVLVSLDSKEPYEQQITAAQDFFSTYPQFASDFLLKPEGTNKYLDAEKIAAHADRLANFDLIGVTEKELGDKMMDRLAEIAKLRTRLDDARISAPIHVFGSLDPLASILYFVAGAEVFDGLAWLRYAFVDGMAAHPETLAIKRARWGHHNNQRRAALLTNNLDTLAEITAAMKRYLHEPEGNFAAFPHHSDLLRLAYEDLRSRLSEGTSGRKR